MREKTGRLRNKIIAWSLVPSTIILLAVGLVTFNAYARITEQLVDDRNQALAESFADQLSTKLDEYEENLSYLVSVWLADPDSIPLPLPIDERTRVFDEGVFLLDKSGKVIGVDSAHPALLGTDLAAAPYFQESRLFHQPTWSDVETWGSDGSKIILVTVPLLGPDGEFRGAGVGMIRLNSGEKVRSSEFWVGLYKILGIARGNTIYIVDRSGHAVLHSDTYRIGGDIAGQAIVQQVLKGTTGGLRTRDLDGKRIVASFAPVPGTPWSLVTEEDWAELAQVSERYRQFLLVLLFLGALVPVVVVAIGARRITRPINDLIQAASHIADGHFDRRIQADTGDELQSMASHFNRMADELEESYATLERRVETRTRELQAVNSVAATVNRSLDLQEVMEQALDIVLAITHNDVGSALLLEPEGEKWEIVAHRGFLENMLARIPDIPLGTATVGQAVSEMTPVLSQIDDYSPSLKTYAREKGIQSVISIPLTAKGKTLGTIYLGSRTRRSTNEVESAMLSAIGQQVGMAVENARLYQNVEEVAVSAERNRLARDLHDSVTQTLFSASLIADVIPRLWEHDPDEGKRRLEEVRQLTRGALAEMRTLLLELRPTALEGANLDELLIQLGEAINGRARIPVNVQIEGKSELPGDIKVALYRIAQESLNNVVKHANATHIHVRYSGNDQGVTLSIEDDGGGFNPGEVCGNNLGLGIMRERAGSCGIHLRFKSRMDKGTIVTATWEQPSRGVLEEA